LTVEDGRILTASIQQKAWKWGQDRDITIFGFLFSSRYLSMLFYRCNLDAKWRNFEIITESFILYLAHRSSNGGA
jgi:hypothetical protein